MAQHNNARRLRQHTIVDVWLYGDFCTWHNRTIGESLHLTREDGIEMMQVAKSLTSVFFCIRNGLPPGNARRNRGEVAS